MPGACDNDGKSPEASLCSGDRATTESAQSPMRRQMHPDTAHSRSLRTGRVRSAHGFTLIELLVVIAIISLLVSILIPSLKRAKELTRRVVCASNLHQIGVALMTYTADHHGDFPEGGRTTSVPYFSDFYGRGWKKSLYPKYIQVPELCYCPTNGYGPKPYYHYWEHAGLEWSAVITYVYTPNQATVTEDLQGDVFPRNAEEADSAQALMADVCDYLGGDGWGGVHYSWNHFWDDPEGGNFMGGDAHVEWKSFHQQKLRYTIESAWGTYEHWW